MVKGGAGADEIFVATSAGAVVAYGEAGNDKLRIGSGAGQHTLSGGEGDDQFEATIDDRPTGSVHIDGGDGLDRLVLRGGDPVGDIQLATGVIRYENRGVTSTYHFTGVEAFTIYTDALIVGSDQAEVISGRRVKAGAGDDRVDYFFNRGVLEGGAGNDTLVAGTLYEQYYSVPDPTTVLIGDDGDDVLMSGWGGNRLDGGSGSDTVSYANSKNGQVADLFDEANNDGFDARGDDFDSIENLVGTGYADWLRGADDANRLDGGAGRDTLIGEGGSDTLLGGDGVDYLRGGVGADQLEGGAAADVYEVDDAGDLVVEEVGTGYTGFNFDTVLTTVDYVLSVNVEKLVSMTGFGVELTANGSDNEVIGNGGNDTLRGLAGSDVIEGAGGTDLIYGGLGVDLIRGGAGNDRILGEQGVDHVYGGAGDDIFFVFNEADHVFENADEGFDTVFTDMAWTAGSNIEKVVSATNFTVLLTGNSLGNELVGNGGNDTLRGLADSDILEGRGGNDLLEGGADGDGLYGYEGDDTLDGGLGNDFLFGASGVDLFVVKGEGVDTLAGFIAGEDDVLLSSALYGAADMGGGVARLVVGAGAASTTALATLLFDPWTGQLSYDADGTGAGAAVLIARFTGDLAAFSTADVLFGP